MARICVLAFVGAQLVGWMAAARADLCELRKGINDTISVDNLSSGGIPNAVAVGGYPSGVGLSPDHHYAYVSSSEETSEPHISVIDIASWRTVDRIGLPFPAVGVAVAADGILYVAGGPVFTGEAEDAAVALAIDPTSKRTTMIALPADTAQARRVAVGGGGRLLYVEAATNTGAQVVHVIDVVRAEVVASHQVSNYGAAYTVQLVASPVDDFAYLMVPSSYERSSYECPTGCPPQVWVLRPDGEPSKIDVLAASASFSPDGALAYLWNTGHPDRADRTAVVETASQTVIDTLPGGRVVAVADGGCVIIAGAHSARRACPGDVDSVPVSASALSPQSAIPVVGDGNGAAVWTEGDCRTPPLACRDDSVCLEVVGASGRPGESVEIGVKLHNHGHAVAGLENNLWPDSALSLAAGQPGSSGLSAVDCRVNPDIDKEHSALVCIERDERGCLAARMLVLSVYNVDPIADDALLYTCTVSIPPDAAPGAYPVGCVDPLASDPDGAALLARCAGDEIVVARHAGAGSVHAPAAPVSASGCGIGRADANGFLSSLALAVLLALRRQVGSRRAAR